MTTLPPMLAGLGASELMIVLVVVLLLFGATKLPELARGSGRALRIFKAETSGLLDDDEATDAAAPSAPSPLEAQRADLARRQAELDLEADRLSRTNSPG